MLLETELLTASHRLSGLVLRAVSDSLSKYQRLDMLVELSSTIARLRGLSSDRVFEVLSTTSKEDLEETVNDFLSVRRAKEFA